MKNKNLKNRLYGMLGIAGVFLVGFVFGNVAKNTNYVKHINIENETTTLSEKTCEAAEQLLLQELGDENTTDWSVHLNNADVYKKILAMGCEEHRDMYNEKLKRSRRLLLALNPDFEEDASTCEQIEKTLLAAIRCRKGEVCMNINTHVEDAQVYANLSERGCPYNADKYKEMAEKELAIARALTDDDIEMYKHETEEIVETYKRIQMQAEAEKILEKAKKLTNPAIDFIMQVEKVMEE